MPQRRPQNAATTAGAMSSAIDADMIRRAEDAVSQLSEEYREWARGDIVSLRDWLKKATDAESRENSYVKIRAIAHDMRGQGSTFGYPLMTRIARSLSVLIKSVDIEEDARALIAAHIDAMAAVIENNVSDQRTAQALDITRGLESATGRTLD